MSWPFDRSNSYYFLVGVGQREKSDAVGMTVSADDADYLERALIAFNIFTERKIRTLTNESATVANVIGGLDDLISKTQEKPADLVIIFFSGHGCSIDGRYYLICRDTQNE